MAPAAELAKWWAKNTRETGRIVRMLSPFEQRPVHSLVKSVPEKTIRKVKENASTLVPAGLLLWGTISWGVAENDRYHREHWS